MPVTILAISGPGGVGKTSVAFEASLILRAAGIAHALIDTDELDRVYPVPDDLPSFAEGNLAALWRQFAGRGVTHLILVGVVLDTDDELEGVRRAIPDACVVPVRLMASPATLVDRVGRREIGSGRAAQLERTAARAEQMRVRDGAGVKTIDTDGMTVEAIAREALRAAGWQ